MRQYLVKGRPNATKENPTPIIYAQRIFAKSTVEATSKFFKYCEELRKMKKGASQLLSVNEIVEKKSGYVKTFGIALRYPSRSNVHNIYKEYRDLTLTGAIGQLYMEMSSRHRVRRNDIAIIRTTTITKKEKVVRKSTAFFFVRLHHSCPHSLLKGLKYQVPHHQKPRETRAQEIQDHL